MGSEPHRYLCERCGGIGQQPAGCWNMATKKYDSPAGVCDDCKGSGYLGVIERVIDAEITRLRRTMGSAPVVKESLTTQLDLDALLAIVRKRTPGELRGEGKGELCGISVHDGKTIGGKAFCSYMNERDCAAIITAVNHFEAVAERCQRAEEILAVACSSPSAELTNLCLLTQRCCDEITIHGFYHQVEWERIDEYRVRPKGAKCKKCGKEWIAQFISRTEKAFAPIEVKVAELIRQRDELLMACNAAKAAVWDAHYGKGIDINYAQSIDEQIHNAVVKAKGKP